MEEEGAGEMDRDTRTLCRALTGYRKKVLSAKASCSEAVMRDEKWKEVEKELEATLRLVREMTGGTGLGISTVKDEEEELLLERYSERLMEMMVKKIGDKPREDINDAVGKG